MSSCTCLRCGHVWYPRPPYGSAWSSRGYSAGYKSDHVPVRCSKCRSPLWNKPYQRKIAPENRNIGSHYDALALPLLAYAGQLPSHDAGGVRNKNASDLNEMEFKKHLDAVSPISRSTVRRKKTISRSVKSCAVRVKSKHVKKKQKTKVKR